MTHLHSWNACVWFSCLLLLFLFYACAYSVKTKNFKQPFEMKQKHKLQNRARVRLRQRAYELGRPEFFLQPRGCLWAVEVITKCTFPLSAWITYMYDATIQVFHVSHLFAFALLPVSVFFTLSVLLRSGFLQRCWTKHQILQLSQQRCNVHTLNRKSDPMLPGIVSIGFSGRTRWST